MPLTPESWERKFRSDARSDKLALFQDHLRLLGLEKETTAEAMLEGTIHLVHACCAYQSIDGQRGADFLAAQTYDPSNSRNATYAFTFDLCGRAWARLLVAADLIIPDLADLLDHPWDEYEVCGYSSFLITRLDGAAITDDEDSSLEQRITDDLTFDNDPDEIEIDFDNSTLPGSLRITVREC